MFPRYLCHVLQSGSICWLQSGFGKLLQSTGDGTATGTGDALRPDSNNAVRKQTFRNNSVAYGRQTATPCPRKGVVGSTESDPVNKPLSCRCWSRAMSLTHAKRSGSRSLRHRKNATWARLHLSVICLSWTTSNSLSTPLWTPSRPIPSVKPTTCSRSANNSGCRLDRACEQSSSTSRLPTTSACLDVSCLSRLRSPRPYLCSWNWNQIRFAGWNARPRCWTQRTWIWWMLGWSSRITSTASAAWSEDPSGRSVPWRRCFVSWKMGSGMVVWYFEGEGKKAYVSAMYLCDSPECQNATLSVIFDPGERPRSFSVAGMVLLGLVGLIIIVCAVLFILFRSRAIKTAEEIHIMQSNDTVV